MADTTINAQVVSGTEEERLAIDVSQIEAGTIWVTLPAVPAPNPPVSPATVQVKAYVVLDVGGVRQFAEICCDAVTGP